MRFAPHNVVSDGHSVRNAGHSVRKVGHGWRPCWSRNEHTWIHAVMILREDTRIMARSKKTVWIAELCVSQRTEQKLIHKHRLTVEEVEDAVVCVRGLQGAWDDHPERGRRLLIQAKIRGCSALVVLYPTDDPDVWHLGSAYIRP